MVSFADSLHFSKTKLSIVKWLRSFLSKSLTRFVKQRFEANSHYATVKFVIKTERVSSRVIHSRI